MTSQVASSLLLVAGELVALLRDWLTRRRQDQAAGIKPEADEVKAKIDSLVAEALAREAARRSAASPNNGAAAPEALGTQDHDELLRLEVEKFVREAVTRAAARRAASRPAATAEAPGGSTGPHGDSDALRNEIEHLVHEALLHAESGPPGAPQAAVPPDTTTSK